MQSHKKDLSNNEFPTFNGEDLDEFLAWYNNILAILASTGWNDLYDDTATDSPIAETIAQNDIKLKALSADLYSYLHVAMKMDAQVLMEDKIELRGQGLAFLQSIFDSYNVTLAGGVIAERKRRCNPLPAQR